MGLSKEEVRLRRLLAAIPEQKNEAKLKYYVGTMRELLAVLMGDDAHQGLPSITAAKANEYARRIEAVAQSVKGRAVPDSAVNALILPSEVPTARSNETTEVSTAWSNRGSEVSPTLRRRLPRENGIARQSNKLGRFEATTQTVIQKHRELQEGLTDEMVVLASQLKDHSLLMDRSLRETEEVLESTEAAVEHSLATTNRANLRTGRLYSQSWKTGCLTWLLLFVVSAMFLFMVFLIRVT